ncbi:uncharacterized protein [Macrobrachium rosenbergii]|uniref:uncharacterized protein isoform X2 n=1 Tax=Macrobrachium rosenbergii TaxID=79674 RepID=UPI0034D4A959
MVNSHSPILFKFFLGLVHLGGATITSGTYEKTRILPQGLSCTMSTYPVPAIQMASSRVFCLSLCNKNSTCNACCIKEGTCYLLKMKLSPGGLPEESPAGMGQCYGRSNRPSPPVNNWARNATVTYDGTLQSGLSESSITTGAICESNGTFCFAVTKESTPSVTLDLGTLRSIKTIVITASDVYSEHFSDITVSVSQSIAAIGSPFATYSGPPTSGERITFSNNMLFLAQYVVIAKPSGMLSFCLIEVYPP